MSILRRVKRAASGVAHLGNSSHTAHGPRNPKPPNPIKSGNRMASHVQAPHKPDTNPYGLHQAQLNDAKRAMASSVPYNPRAKKKKSTTRAGSAFKTPIHPSAKKYYR
jgi:hypothetical protein